MKPGSSRKQLGFSSIHFNIFTFRNSFQSLGDIRRSLLDSSHSFLKLLTPTTRLTPFSWNRAFYSSDPRHLARPYFSGSNMRTDFVSLLCLACCGLASAVSPPGTSSPSFHFLRRSSTHLSPYADHLPTKKIRKLPLSSINHKDALSPHYLDTAVEKTTQVLASPLSLPPMNHASGGLGRKVGILGEVTGMKMSRRRSTLWGMKRIDRIREMEELMGGLRKTREALGERGDALHALRYSLEVDPLASHSSTFTTLLSSLLSSYHLSLASLPHIISDLSHSLNSDKSAMFNVEHHYSAIPVKAVMESVLEGVREVLEDVNAMVYEASPLGKVVGPEMADIKSAVEEIHAALETSELADIGSLSTEVELIVKGMEISVCRFSPQLC